MATIIKRGDVYRVQIRKVGHPAVSRTFRTHAEAKRWATQAEATIDKGKRVDRRTTTFGEIVDACTGNVGAMSRSKDGALKAIRSMLGRERLGHMTAARIIRFAEQRAGDGAGPATISQDLSYIGTVLRHGAVLLDLDASVALDGLAGARRVLTHGGKIARPAERDRRPTEVELQAMFSHWRVHPPRELPMVDLVLFTCATAMRLSEITSLDRLGLDLRTRTILIRDRKHPRQKKGNDQTVPLLSGHLTIAGDIIDPLAIIERQPRRGSLIFPYRAESISTAFTRAVRTCGIEDLHFHDMRHHGCSLLFEAGYRIEEVSLVSGHRDWNMLRRYTQIRPETLHRSSGKLSNVTALQG